ncbi:flagellar biosynthetic protein FliO [Photobacterium aphoticum]|uniref:Flagellar protein n=1 Tax=Photobacterium aphoticum TaxID=754436 RepID=A0A090QYH3_9GAMM|nr:flagellar biosynthetic protein FliO [Photobacterium aphoticum]KLV02535.1 hypothetical protein ABT58_02495 [Photobacterium aphoticum]PSU51230.1 flagellar biosynthetic protein FliO [Photobacterium aphoticum]GAL06914.1 flagellar biosynthesis protein FliQ [Photobacterium aphoticum]GHA47548.1 flagellar protein [Photobacterium aphoticum]
MATGPELNLATTFASLMFVVILIIGLAWLIKRMKWTGIQSGPSPLRIVRQLSVGQRERIVLLQVGDEQMLVGVTQQNISLLSKLDQPLPTEAGLSGGDFAQQLSTMLKKHETK